jgi:hypothetical protein
VVAVDKRTKDVLSSAEPLDGNLLVVLAPYSAAVAEPVMIAIGQYDRFFCPPSEIDCSSPEALLATEGANYAGARCVDAVVMPNTGHDLAIQPSAPVSQSTVVAWADAVVAERESQWRFAC